MVGELGMALLSYAVFLLYHLLILQVILVFVFFFAIVPAFISEISHISQLRIQLKLNTALLSTVRVSVRPSQA